MRNERLMDSHTMKELSKQLSQINSEIKGATSQFVDTNGNIVEVVQEKEVIISALNSNRSWLLIVSEDDILVGPWDERMNKFPFKKDAERTSCFSAGVEPPNRKEYNYLSDTEFE